MEKIREIATAGYNAYADSAGWPEPMGPWSELSPEVQSHWVNSVGTIGAMY